MTRVPEQLGDRFAGLRELDVRPYQPGVILRDHLLGADGEALTAGGEAGTTNTSWSPPPRTASTASAAVHRTRTLPPPFNAGAT